MKLWVMLVGLWAALRLWLLLSFWTVVCSALLTYFLLHQGAQLDAPEAMEEPPQMELISATHEKVDLPQSQYGAAAPTMAVRPLKASVVGVPTNVSVRLRNEGSGKLRIALVAASCGCSEVAFDGKKMEAVGDKDPTPGQVCEVAPGKDTIMTVTWTAQEKNRAIDGMFRLTVTLNVNDPRFADRARLEIATPLATSP